MSASFILTLKANMIIMYNKSIYFRQEISIPWWLVNLTGYLEYDFNGDWHQYREEHLLFRSKQAKN